MLRLCFLRYDFKIILKIFWGGEFSALIHSPRALYTSKKGFALCMLTGSITADPLVLLWLCPGTGPCQGRQGLGGASPALIQKGAAPFPMWRGWERHWQRGLCSAAADLSLRASGVHLVLYCHDHPQVRRGTSSFGESRGQLFPGRHSPC